MARWLSIAILVGLSAQAESPDAPVGGKAFVDRRNPPSYRLLDEAESAQVSLGRSVFDTQWAAAGTPGVGGRVGVGPLYNATSCKGRQPLANGAAVGHGLSPEARESLDVSARWPRPRAREALLRWLETL